MALETVARFLTLAERNAAVFALPDVGKLVRVFEDGKLYRINRPGAGAGIYSDVEGGGGSGETLLTRQLTNVDLTAAAVTQQFTLGHTFVAGETPTKVRVKVTTLGSGGTLADLQMDVGVTGSPSILTNGIDLFTGAPGPYDGVTASMQGLTSIAPSLDIVGKDVIVDINATGENVNNITAFDATVYVTIGTAGT